MILPEDLAESWEEDSAPPPCEHLFEREVTLVDGTRVHVCTLCNQREIPEEKK